MPDIKDTNMIQQGWDDFVKEYNLIMKFGVEALALAASKGQTLNESHIKGLIPQLEQKIEQALDQSLSLVNKMLKQEQTPRADNQPELTNRQILGEQAPAPAAPRQYEQAPWADKFDLAANTSNQEAFNDFKQMINQRNEIVNQYKNKLKMSMSKRMENKLTMKYVPKITPRRPGE